MILTSLFSFFKKKAPPKPVIVIPIYHWPLEDHETLSLKVVRKILGSSHPVHFISPRSLPLPPDFLQINERIIRFDDCFFHGISGYNQMLVSKWFFQFFSHQFTHILIYQLDCLVFFDRLHHFCNQGFDYIGAPWFKYFLEDPSEGLWAAGNGGFSLRNIQSTLAIFETKVRKGRLSLGEGLAAHYANPSNQENPNWLPTQSVSVSEEIALYPYNEDLFWSFEAPLINPSFRVAPPKKALRFSFEKLPLWCYKHNKKQLPFGCHAWQKNETSFWLNHLLRLKIVSPSEIPDSLQIHIAKF